MRVHRSGVSLFWPLGLVLLLCQVQFQPIAALASSSPMVECHPHPTQPQKEVCLTNFVFISPSPSGPPTATDPYTWVGGWSWSYTFVEGIPEGTYTEYVGDGEPYVELNTNNTMGERVTVAIDDNHKTCRISGCQSCTLCQVGEWTSNERQNAYFQADCTNLPGGRNVTTCESVLPFFMLIDYWATEKDEEDSLPIDWDSEEEDSMAPSSLLSEVTSEYLSTVDDSTTDSPTDTTTISSSSSSMPSSSISSPAPSSIPTAAPTRKGTCRGDLIYSACAPTCEVTCDSRDDYFPIVDGKPCNTWPWWYCRNACVCPPSKPIRVDDGTDECLEHPRDCPAKTTTCPGDMVFQECGNTCPPTCTNAIPLVQDGGRPCIYPNACSVGCYCPDDKPIAVGDDTGRCVTTRMECPAAPPVEEGSPTAAPTVEVTYAGLACTGDLVFLTCGSSCPSLTCAKPNLPPDLACPTVCVSGCYCPSEKPLLLDDRMDICVANVQECPAPENDSMLLDTRAGLDSPDINSIKKVKADKSAEDVTNPTTTTEYDFKSDLIVTFFPETGQEPTTFEMDGLLMELEVSFHQWLVTTNPSSQVHLIYTSYQYDGVDAPDMVQIEFQTMVRIPSEIILTERHVATLLTKANFGSFIAEQVRRNPDVGVFENTFKVVFKAVGTGGS